MALVTSADARGRLVAVAPALLAASTWPSVPYTTTSSAPLSTRCASVASAQFDGGLSARRFANSCGAARVLAHAHVHRRLGQLERVGQALLDLDLEPAVDAAG